MIFFNIILLFLYVLSWAQVYTFLILFGLLCCVKAQVGYWQATSQEAHKRKPTLIGPGLNKSECWPSIIRPNMFRSAHPSWSWLYFFYWKKVTRHCTRHLRSGTKLRAHGIITILDCRQGGIIRTQSGTADIISTFASWLGPCMNYVRTTLFFGVIYFDYLVLTFEFVLFFFHF